MPKGPLSRKCQHANVEQEIHRSAESLQVPLGRSLPHEALGKPEPPALPQQLCWWKRIPLQTGGTGGMATSLPWAPWGSVWKKIFHPVEEHTNSVRASPQRASLGMCKAAAFGEAGWGERNG